MGSLTPVVTSNPLTGPEQFGRKISLVVGTAGDLGPTGGPGYDLSNLHVKFQTRQLDNGNPNSCQVRVYNLSEDTANKIEKVFTVLLLSAGYEGTSQFGLIFYGTLVQARRGREDAPTSYVDLSVVDGDAATNFSIISQTLAAGASFADRVNVLKAAMSAAGTVPLQQGHVTDLGPQKSIRGVTMHGKCSDELRKVAQATNTSWSVQNGCFQMLSYNEALPGTATVLSPTTGLIGLPEQTNDGIKVRCLLNPLLKVGALIQVDQALIQQEAVQLGYQSSAQNALIPTISPLGIYRILVIVHTGDTRGQPWYSDIIAVALGTPSPNPQAALGRE